MVQFDSTQNVCPKCEAVHVSIDCPVCYPGKFASAVDKLFGFHRPLPFVAALFAGLALAGGAVAVDPSPQGPEVVDVSVGQVTGGFQSKAIFFRTPLVGWPHSLNRAELRSVATGVRVIHSRIFRDRGLPKGVGAVCKQQRGTVQCSIRNRGGKQVAWYPVKRIFEDGSVVVFLPLAPSMSVSLG